MCATPKRPLRVAFVVQRYGEEVNGGAEALCRLVAERMSRHWTVDVFTTCALDYITWGDHYPPGFHVLNGVNVRRFPVAAPRDIELFNQLSEELRADPSPGLKKQEEWMRAQGPWSPALLDALATGRDHYDLFIFFGYLYALSYFGVPLVGPKAILAPLGHDEWPIHLPMWDSVFAMPSAFIFNTVEERRFLRARFPRARLRGTTVGVAVDRPADVEPRRFRFGFGVPGGFLLYVGRIDPSKGCGEMFDFFLEHVRKTGDERLLLTLGRAVMAIPSHPQILPLGFVSERDKWDALAACDVLLMPSPFESLSMVLLEAWSVQRPVLVNGACEVLLGQVRRAHGGLAYRSAEEFSAALDELSRGGAASVLGRQGHDFVRERYTWEAIEREYLEAAAVVHEKTTTSRNSPPARYSSSW